MATTENFVFGDGGDTYSFSFPYLKTEDVRVELQEYDDTQPVGDKIISRSSTSAFTIPAGNPTQIIFNAIGADTVYQTADGNVREESDPGEYPVRIRIYRATQPDATPATFFAGSAIRAQDLNDNFDQILYIMQEKENALISIQTGGIGDNVISTSAIQDDAVDANILRDSVSDDSNRAVTTNHIRDNAVTTAKIDNDAVTTAELASDLTIDLASGTVDSPSLTFDANTGLYSPGEDQVAISTNGTQRLLIANNGWVGVGVTPASVFHVKNPQPSIILENNGGIGSGLVFKTTGNATSDFVITAGSSGSGFYSNQHKFYNVAGTAEYMCLDSDGRLLVGTTSASGSAKLQVAGDITATGDATIGSLNGGPLSGARNRIINGDMRIDQRNDGASVSSGINSLTYTVDRWSVAASNAAVTVQRLGTAAEYYLNVTGAASVTACNIRHRIESKNIADLAGSTVTLSFKCSSSSLTSLSTALVYADSVDNFATGTVISSVNISITSTPTIYSTSFSLPANAANGVQVIFSLGAFTSGTFTLTDVQLEPGSIVTPFERRSYGDELALCQRYYESIGATYSIASQANVVNFWHSFKVTKRADPTVTGSRTFTGITVQGFSAYTDSSTTTTVDNASAEL